MGEMVSIERSRYDELLESERILEELEDSHDLKIVAEFRANPTEGLPDVYMGRLLNGENHVLVYREWRGWSGAELARRAGLNRVQVHDIESGKRRGSVDTLKKIAEALRVPLDLIA